MRSASGQSQFNIANKNNVTQINRIMITKSKFVALSLVAAAISIAIVTKGGDSIPQATSAAQWNDKDQLLQPINYREWIFEIK